MTELRPNNPPTKEAEFPDKPNLYEGLANCINRNRVQWTGNRTELEWAEPLRASKPELLAWNIVI